MSQLAPNTTGINIAEVVDAADTTTNAYRLAAELTGDNAPPPGVEKRLDEAVRYLLHAGFTLAWGSGLRARVLGAVYTKVFWLRRRRVWPHHRDKGFTAVAELALVHTSKVKKQADTAVWHQADATGDLPGAAADITRAWLLLGQVAYALQTGACLLPRPVPAPGPGAAADIPDRIAAIVERLAPLAVTMAGYSGSHTLAPAAGLAVLAHQRLTDTLNAIAPWDCARSGLDLTTCGLDLPAPNNPRQARLHVAELCGLLHDQADEARLTAGRINDPSSSTPWRPKTAANLATTAMYLTAASKRFRGWATNQL